MTCGISLACEQALLFGRVKRVSRERASERRSREGQRKGELATIPYKCSFVLRPDEGKYHWLKNDVPEIKLIDNRPSWHSLRLYVKFGSQGDQIGTENLLQPSMQTGSFDVILANRILRAEDKSDRVCSSCGGKMKTLHQLYSFMTSALSSSENRESESRGVAGGGGPGVPVTPPW